VTLLLVFALPALEASAFDTFHDQPTCERGGAGHTLRHEDLRVGLDASDTPTQWRSSLESSHHVAVNNVLGHDTSRRAL
jgi:hypothetical protein